jgi:hypothetical protein
MVWTMTTQLTHTTVKTENDLCMRIMCMGFLVSGDWLADFVAGA